MTEALLTGYLAGLPEDQRNVLARANRVGLVAFRQYLATGQAMAFLGAGASSPLYPLWDALIAQLLNAASDRLTESQVATCKALAAENPEEVVEIVRRSLGTATYWEVLREVLRVRTDPGSGRTWTPVQEVVCRCPFKAVITTNYDPGIVDARMRVRPSASARASRRGWMIWAWIGGVPEMFLAMPNFRCCTRMGRTISRSRWCLRPPSTGAHMRES